MKSFKEYYKDYPEYIVFYDKESPEIYIFIKNEDIPGCYTKKYVIRRDETVDSFVPQYRVHYKSLFQLDADFLPKYWKKEELSKDEFMNKFSERIFLDSL